MFNGRFYRLFVKIYEALLKIADNILATTYNDSWINITSSVTYSSVDDPTGVITIEEDLTGVLSVGMRIKFTNGGNTIYGIITKDPTYSSPNTTITFLHEINPTDSQALHLLANSAITNVYYSHQKAPFGFPSETEKWQISLTDTTLRTKNSPAQDTWYYSDLGSLYLDLPIGSWKNLKFEAFTRGTKAGDTLGIYTALSTSSSSPSNSSLIAGFFAYSDIIGTLTRSINVTVTSKTRYYLIARTTTGSVSALQWYNSLVGLKIIATCAYL
jgi:hypothetical protein